MVSSLETETIQIQPPSPQNQTAAPHSQKRSTTQLNSPSRFAVAIGRFFPHPSVSAFTFIYLCVKRAAQFPRMPASNNIAHYTYTPLLNRSTLLYRLVSRNEIESRVRVSRSVRRAPIAVWIGVAVLTHTHTD